MSEGTKPIHLTVGSLRAMIANWPDDAMVRMDDLEMTKIRIDAVTDCGDGIRIECPACRKRDDQQREYERNSPCGRCSKRPTEWD